MKEATLSDIDLRRVKPEQVVYTCAACGSRWVGPSLTPQWAPRSVGCQGEMVLAPNLPLKGKPPCA